MATVIVILVIAIVIETLVIGAFIATVNSRMNKLENYLDEDSIAIKNLSELAKANTDGICNILNAQKEIFIFIKDRDNSIADMLKTIINKPKKTTKKVTNK